MDDLRGEWLHFFSFLLHLPFSKQCVNTSLYFAAFSLLCVCESRPLLVNRNPLAMRVLPTETKGMHAERGVLRNGERCTAILPLFHSRDRAIIALGLNPSILGSLLAFGLRPDLASRQFHLPYQEPEEK